MQFRCAEYLDNVSTVLLIDDSKFLRRANELSLAKAGHKILTASDGEEGLRLAREKRPDVIVLDMMLPKLGGAQLLQLLKGDPLTAKVPVIVLSSLPQKMRRSSSLKVPPRTWKNQAWLLTSVRVNSREPLPGSWVPVPRLSSSCPLSENRPQPLLFSRGALACHNLRDYSKLA